MPPQVKGFLSMLCLCCLSAAAQTTAGPIARHEIGVGIGISTDHPYGSVPALAPYYRSFGFLTPDVRYDFNLNRHLALEAEASASTNHVTLNVREGGQQVLVVGGLRAGLRRGRWGFFGTSEAGALSFSKGQGENSATGPVYNRLTHFALRQGAAVQYNVSRRDFVRFDATELLDVQFKRTYFSSPIYSVTSFANVANHWNTTLSVGHSFGRMGEYDGAPDARVGRGYSVGGLYALGIREHLLLGDAHAFGGGGVWVEAPAWRFVSFDLVAMDHPKSDKTSNVQDGGSTFQAYAGPKVGFRVGGVGLYAKARPGLVRFSRVITFQGRDAVGNFISMDHPKIDFSLDTGLVLQYVPPGRALRHVATRFEAGSTLDFYPKATLTTNFPTAIVPMQTFTYAAQRHSSLLILSGVGFAW